MTDPRSRDATEGAADPPLHVVALLHDFPPRTVIGAYIVTHRWLWGLHAAGHRVTVIRTQSRPAGLREFIGADGQVDWTCRGIEVLPRGGHAVNDPRHPARQADVIVGHLGKKDNLHGAHRRLAAQWGIPCVTLAHSRNTDSTDDDIATQLDGVALLVANSHATVDALGWDGPTVVCQPPTPPALYRTNPGDLVTQINLQRDKGSDVFWRLTERLPDVNFLAQRGWAIQVGPAGEQIGRLEVPELPPNVQWGMPVLPQEMRDRVYSRTAILLVPSWTEAWGQVGIEAACSGIPTIASDLPGLREALGTAGTFVAPDDTDGWVEALRRLLEPGAWLSASAAASGRAATLNPQVSIDRFVEAVQQTVRGGKSCE